MEKPIEEYNDLRKEYRESIKSIIGGINPQTKIKIDMNKLISEFLNISEISTQNMKVLSGRYIEKDLLRFGFRSVLSKIINDNSLLSEQEVLSSIPEENIENIVNFLAQENYRGITLQQIATLIRYQLTVKLSEKVASTARQQAIVNGEDKRKFYNSPNMSNAKIEENYKRQMGYINPKDTNRILTIVLEEENKIIMRRIKKQENNEQIPSNVDSSDYSDIGKVIK